MTLEEFSFGSEVVSGPKPGIRVGGQWISMTHLGKVLFPDDGITKQHLINYYFYASGYLLRYVRDRPLMMQRVGWRDGSINRVFVQQRPSSHFPDWIERVTVDLKGSKEKGAQIEHVVCDSAATLIYLVNQGMITPHVWASRIDHPDIPDQLIFDLDPGESGFDAVRETAFLLKTLLEQEGLKPYVMTTGSDGVHVRAPIRRVNGFDFVRTRARELADAIVSAHPTRATTEIRKTKRNGKVFIDTLRNSYGQNSVAPYAIRARPSAPVATPITWEELRKETVTASCFTIANIHNRLATVPDPWAQFFRHARNLR